jgi:hypothetical protein
VAFYLELDSLSMQIPGAWQINRSLLRLLGGPVKRGENVMVPGVPGRDDVPRLPDETVYDLELLVRGLNDHTAAPFGDEIEGKVTNLRYLQGRFGEEDGTIGAELYLPDGTSLTGTVQVINWMVAADQGAVATVTFDLVLVDGVWTPVP